MIDKGMTSSAVTRAKENVYNVCSQGSQVTLIKQGTKDEFGRPLTESTLNLYSHPIRISPFSRNVLNAISWAESVDIIFYVSMKEVEDNDKTVHTLKMYKNIKFDKKVYEIKYIDNWISFGTTFLYIIIGARAK